MGGADDREAVLRLGVADGVAAGQRPAGLPDLGRGAREDLGQHVARQVLGERRDRQGEEDAAAHREDIGQGVRGRDLAERARVVDQRREEVERADDRQVVADPVGGGVVGRVEAGEEGARSVRGRLGTKARERLGQQVRTELRGTAAAVGQLGQAERQASVVVMRPMIRLPSPRERSGPGGSPGLQNQWRGARRGAVGSTPTRSRHGGFMSSDRPRPPSVERLLTAVRPRVEAGTDADALAAVAREVVAEERVSTGDGAAPREIEVLADAIVARLDAFAGPPADAAINATGVIVHTNLGRAPWPAAAIDAAAGAGGPLLLEIDRQTGRRGARFRRAEEHLIALTGAEDALITNNNAAAVALAVGLAGRGGVVVSRGELVEIGGGVRIPEIIRRAGAKLIEVGTTNRTRAADFEEPLAAGRAKAVLRVHPSNFAITGFTAVPDPGEVAAAAHRHGAIVIDDLGSGALLPTERFGLAHEPTPAERLAAGSDVVLFSGDKLVGGPQAGLVVGRADLVARMRRDPLARAMRPDKATLLGVAATLGQYRAGLAVSRIPVWVMIATSADALRARAEQVVAWIGAAAEVVPLRSTVGGGSLPGETIPSFGVAVGSPSADRLLAAIRRHGRSPVIGRIEDGRVVLDLRTVDPSRDRELASKVQAALLGGS